MRIGLQAGWQTDLIASKCAGHLLEGAGMAYVFVHLLPELASHGKALSDAPGMETFAPTPITEALLFLISLV